MSCTWSGGPLTSCYNTVITKDVSGSNASYTRLRCISTIFQTPLLNISTPNCWDHSWMITRMLSPTWLLVSRRAERWEIFEYVSRHLKGGNGGELDSRYTAFVWIVCSLSAINQVSPNSVYKGLFLVTIVHNSRFTVQHMNNMDDVQIFLDRTLTSRMGIRLLTG